MNGNNVKKNEESKKISEIKILLKFLFLFINIIFLNKLNTT